MERLKGNDLMSIVPQFLEGAAFGILNNILSGGHSNDGYAQPNRYEVLVFPPTKFSSDQGQNFSRDMINKDFSNRDKGEISLRCESITLPGRNLSSTPDTNIHGPLREIVNNVNFADSVAMVFQASTDLRERVFFEKWQYAAFNPKTWNVGYYNDYIGSVFIYLLDKQDQRKYGLKLWECFPKSISQTELSYASNNEIIKLTVDMNFRYWTSLDITQETPSLSDRIGQTITDVIHRKITGAIPSVLRRL
jgi:hypothetical protein